MKLNYIDTIVVIRSIVKAYKRYSLIDYPNCISILG